MRLLKMLGLLALLGGMSLGATDKPQPTFPERKTFQFGEFTIEASAGDEAYVEALAVRLVDYKLPEITPSAQAKLSLEELSKRRDFFLGKIATMLGLAQATAEMQSGYAKSVKYFLDMRDGAPTQLPRHYALWHRAEIIARLAADEKVEGILREGADGLSYTSHFSHHYEPSRSTAEPDRTPESGHSLDAWNQVVCPIVIGDKPGKTPAEDVAGGLDVRVKAMLTAFRDMMNSTERLNVFIVLSETTEASVVSQYLASKDCQWFRGGVADFVAWKIIESEVGAAAARSYYIFSSELKPREGAVTQNEVAGPAVENVVSTKITENADMANRTAVMNAMVDVCAKQGDDFLPRLFREIGRTPREKATMATVYKSFKRLTKEDLHSYLPKPAERK